MLVLDNALDLNEDVLYRTCASICAQNPQELLSTRHGKEKVLPVIMPDNISDGASIVIVIISMYYGVKLVRLSREMEFVALKGGRAPYYIMVGMGFLALNRIFDLLAENFFAEIVGNELATTLDDPPALLAALFTFLGLRNMYEVYRKGSTLSKGSKVEEIWTTESSKASD